MNWYNSVNSKGKRSQIIVGNDWKQISHRTTCFRVFPIAADSRGLFERHGDLPWAGSGTVGVSASTIPLLTARAPGMAACKQRWLCEGAATIHSTNSERNSPCNLQLWPKERTLNPFCSRDFWHPFNLFGLKEEDMEKEGDGLTPTSPNLLLQEDGFFANSFLILLPVISTEG